MCEDGTKTLFSKEFDEPYHSTKDGALHESLEKHVKPALSHFQDKETLRILDICFGLGYNTFATLYYVKQHQLPVHIHIVSPEFDEVLVRSLKAFDYPKEFDMLSPIIEAISNDFYYEDEQFKIEVLIGDAREILSSQSTHCLLPADHTFDIVYQDAFSPAHNPLLWTREHFRDVRSICSEEAFLTTYSTAAAVRLGLYENGFNIYVQRAEKMRYSTVASLKMLEGMEYIDMELKKVRNPAARSMRDKAFKTV